MKPLIPIKRGEPITAKYLGTLAENQNEAIREIRRLGTAVASREEVTDPSQANIDPRAIRDDQDRANGGVAGLATDAMWREVSRSVSTVRVENPSDPAQFVDVERVDQIVLINGAGQLMAFTFNNP